MPKPAKAPQVRTAGPPMHGGGPVTGKSSFREIRYHEKQRKILDNAARLFAKKGYENVPLEEIAAKLKLTKASLYHYFKSKDELFFRIQMEAAQRANTCLEEVLASANTPEEKLKEAIKRHVRVVTSDYATSLFRQKDVTLPPKLMEQVGFEHDRFERNFLRIIMEGAENGVFEVSHPRLAVLAILGTLNAIPRWYNPKGPLSAEEIGNALAAFILKGLSAKA